MDEVGGAFGIRNRLGVRELKQDHPRRIRSMRTAALDRRFAERRVGRVTARVQPEREDLQNSVTPPRPTTRLIRHVRKANQLPDEYREDLEDFQHFDVRRM